MVRYLTFADQHYRHADTGTPTSEASGIRDALRQLKDRYAAIPAAQFGPKLLKDVRNQWIDAGLARKSINLYTGRVKRFFKWAASEQLIPVTTYQALATVTGLRRGRSNAKETRPVRPAPLTNVGQAMLFLPAPIRGLVLFQRWTGCRPGEAVILRPCDIDRDGAVWVYTPESHKTERLGKERRIPIGPRAQLALQPFLDRDSEAFCFSPAEAMDDFHAQRKVARKTPMTPSQRARQRTKEPARAPKERYTPVSYARAILRVCRRWSIPRWSPNQLRHTAATEIRQSHGLESAQVVLGHASADITQVYAERNLFKAL